MRTSLKTFRLEMTSSGTQRNKTKIDDEVLSFLFRHFAIRSYLLKFQRSVPVKLPSAQSVIFSTESLKCASNPCKNGGICTEDETGYLCDCPVGTTGYNCDGNPLIS